MKNVEVLNSEREALLALGVGSWELGVEPAAGVSRLALILPSSKSTQHFDAIALIARGGGEMTMRGAGADVSLAGRDSSFFHPTSGVALRRLNTARYFAFRSSFARSRAMFRSMRCM